MMRRTGRRARIEALGAALAVIPMFVAVAGISELVGWPHTRTASAPRFVAALLIVPGWTALVLLARRAVQGVRVVERR